MPKFNPKDKPPADEALPAGVFTLGITWFKRKQAKNNNTEYHSVKIQVAGGRLAGRTFFTTMSLDLTKSGAVRRWIVLCEVLGIEHEFELGSTDKGTNEEGDENFRKLFLGRAFKAEVGVSKNGNFVNNEIKTILYPRQYTEQDRADIAAWEAKFKEKGDDFGEPDDRPASTGGDKYFDGLPDDDDIPF